MNVLIKDRCFVRRRYTLPRINVELIRTANTHNTVIIRFLKWTQFVGTLRLIFLQHPHPLADNPGDIAIVCHPSSVLQYCQFVGFGLLAFVLIDVEKSSCGAIDASVLLDAPIFGHQAGLTLLAVVIRSWDWAGENLFLWDGHWCAVLCPVIDNCEISIMGLHSTFSEVRIRLLILRTMCALFGEYIKDRLRLSTEHTLLAIKERLIKWTIGNIMIPDISLIVFFDEIINILIAQYPPIGIDIGLINRRC